MTITDDAAGITKTTKIGTVVDRLLGAPPVSAEAVQRLPLDRIHEHPRNPAGRGDDVDDLVAGIKAIGITNPLIVATAEAYNAGRLDGDPACSDPDGYVIVGGGHRRRAAAKAAGLTTVPCLIRDDLADANGRRAALFENLHRRQLDAFEEAEAFGELVTDYKVTQRDLAVDVGCNQSHISKRLKLLKVPSTVREAQRIGTISIADVVELARLADQPDSLERAFQEVSTRSWISGKQAVDDELRDQERQRKVAAATEQLRGEGVPRLQGQRPAYGLYNKRDAVRLDATGIKPERHAGEECHCAYIENDGEISYVCSRPSRHLPTGASKVKLSKAKRESLDRYASPGNQAADERRLRKQLRDVRGTRRALLTRLLVGDLSDEWLIDDHDQLEHLGVTAQVHGYTFDRNVIRDLLAIPVPDGQAPYAGTQIDEALEAGRVDVELVQTAGWLSQFESQMDVSWHRWDTWERRYLHFLAHAFGYEITDPEHERLGDTRDADGTWQPPAADVDVDVASCRICGCTDAAACDGGCTWIEPDLCSSCSDAQEAGWIGDESMAVAQ